MIQKLTCPHCEVAIKPKQPVPAGKKVRCPKCAESFTVPDEETDAESDEGDEPAPRAKERPRDEDDEEKTPAKKTKRSKNEDDESPPAKKTKRSRNDDDGDDEDENPRKKKKAKGNGLIWTLAIGGGVFIVLLVCAGGGIGLWLATKDGPANVGPAKDKGPGPGPAANLKMNMKTWNQLQLLIKKDDVAKLCGPGRNATDDTVIAGLQAAGYDQKTSSGLVDAARKSGTRAWEEYFGGDEVLFVGYAPTKWGDRAAYELWISRKENEGFGAYRVKKYFASSPDPLADIEKSTELREKDESILNDPKWKSGDDARALLVGSWKHATGVKRYEFQKNDKAKEITIGPARSLNYQFTDPQQLKIGNSQYRVLIAADEMYLVQSGSTLIGPFRRQK